MKYTEKKLKGNCLMIVTIFILIASLPLNLNFICLQSDLIYDTMILNLVIATFIFIYIFKIKSHLQYLYCEIYSINIHDIQISLWF